MKRQDTVFDFSIRAHRPLMRTAMAAVIVAVGASANAANVVSRGGGTSTARPTVSRANNADSRMPTLNTRAQSAAAQATAEQQPAEPAQPIEPAEPVPAEPAPTEEPVIIENKADQFSTSMATNAAGGRDSNADNLAEMIRRQRAALDAQSAADTAAAATAASLASGQSACDIGLRDCMKQKCGNDYSKCAGDGDTIWGDKMDACRRNVTCTGHQYTLFSAEIKADRDMNAKLSAYNKIIDCGNEYNECIVAECGVTYSKCLGKTAGDAAISKCGTIAKNCTQQDSGLASRTMNVFATLRQDAEKQIVKDEQRLYELRDKMRAQCQRFGAMFDERSLVCVYTVNFYAGNSTTPMASKKAYAGSAFDCTQDWFGIDVTTFKENAYRYTRSQTSASSALMGSGLGVGVGAVTSGAIDRAIDRQKAEKAAKEAEKQHEADYGDKKSETKEDKKDKIFKYPDHKNIADAYQYVQEHCDTTNKDNFTAKTDNTECASQLSQKDEYKDLNNTSCTGYINTNCDGITNEAERATCEKCASYNLDIVQCNKELNEWCKKTAPNIVFYKEHPDYM